MEEYCYEKKLLCLMIFGVLFTRVTPVLPTVPDEQLKHHHNYEDNYTDNNDGNKVIITPYLLDSPNGDGM